MEQSGGCYSEVCEGWWIEGGAGCTVESAFKNEKIVVPEHEAGKLNA